MAITINVQGVNSGGGNNNQQPPTPPTPPQQPMQNPAPTPTSSQPQQPASQPSQQTYTQPMQQTTSHQQQTPPPSQQTNTQSATQQPTTASVSQPTQQPNQSTTRQTVDNQAAQTQTQTSQPMPDTGRRTVVPDDSRLANQNQQTARPLYQRPDFSQYSQSNQPTNAAIPTSDRLVGDIQAEISRRGIILLPGSANYSTMLNTLQQQQRTNVMGQIENQYNNRLYDVDSRKESLIQEINSRIEAARKSELSETTDPDDEKQINQRYDRELNREIKAADAFFKPEYDSIEKRHTTDIAEAEQRIAEAIQRVTANLPNQQTAQQQDSVTRQNDIQQPQQPSTIPYQRPDFSQYSQSNQPTNAATGSAIPTSDRIVDDIQAEIARRGIVLTPNATTNSRTLDALQQGQRDSIMSDVDSQYKSRIADIDNRRDSLMDEINSRLEASRKSELATTNDPVERKRINNDYDKLADKEEKSATRFFKPQFEAEEQRHTSEIAEAERRIAEAMQRVTNSLQNHQTTQNNSQQQQNNTQQQQSIGGGNNNGGNGNTSTPPTPIPYKRPDFSQYAPSGNQGVNNPLPTSDRMVNDIRAEISRRGIILVPGTQNFSTMLNTMQQNMRTNVMGQIDSQHEARIADIDKRDSALYNEIKARLDVSRQSELAGADPLDVKQINDRYDRLEQREFRNAGQFFAGEYDAATTERDSQRAEAEQRLTDAMQRLTEELSQGNKDSYLNNLRDKYKTAIWQRDNAATEEEVKAASREAAKIQERMQRAMSANSGINWGSVATVAIGGIANMANIYAQGERLEDQRKWGLPVQMSRAILGGNAYAAYSQQAAAEQQRIENNWTLGGAAIGTAAGVGGGILAGAGAGAALGSVIPGAGTIVGAIVGTAIAALGTYLGAQGGYFFGGGQELEREKKKADAADLWTQVESRMMQFNGLAMMMRPFANGAPISAIRDTFINQANATTAGAAGGAFIKSDDHLDLYDLGYTAPEFAQQVVSRTKARGYSTGVSDAEYALRQDALERYYNMAPNALTALSSYDRFGRNNANQDFANLATTLSSMNTLGMSEKNGGFVRGEEFVGYMTQLGQQQRSTFLTVDNARAGRQIATGQEMFGTQFGAETMQGIQQVNNTIQNPKGGFAQTLLYDVIQELYPDTRGRIDKIEQAQYDPAKQNEIQQEYQRRIQSIYGGVDTTAGYLAAQEIWGIQNPNVMMPIVRQLGKQGGLEAHSLEKGDVNAVTNVLNNEEYTPSATQGLKNASDQQTAILLKYQTQMKDIASDILTAIKKDITQKLDEAVQELHNVNN